MKLLLDTHALLWWAHEPAKLSKQAASAIADGDNVVLVSAVSAFEIAIKDRKGALDYRTSLADRFATDVVAHGFTPLSIDVDHAGRAGGFTWGHKDPWDRLLAAQSIIEDIPLVTIDPVFQRFGVRTFW